MFRPTCGAHLPVAAGDPPGGASRDVERRRRADYGALAPGVRWRPFVLDTWGHLGPGTVRFLEELAEERRLADLEAEREKRVAHLQQVAARRVMQMGLARGWSAWLEQYDTHLMHQRMLKQAAARLLRPKLAAAATHWRMEWEAEEKATLARQQELAAGVRVLKPLLRPKNGN